MTQGAPLPQIIDEALRLMGAASASDVPVRLVGGLAVRLRVTDGLHPGLTREYKDIDLVTLKGRSKTVTRFLESLGYEPNQAFNAMNGSERLMFYDLGNERRLDVFVGAFRMCHEIPITDRIALEQTTIPLAELLLTKLQIVQLNEKDLRDILAILHHHEVGDEDGEVVNAGYIAQLCAGDWGLWRTSKMNVARINDSVAEYELAPDERRRVQARLARLWDRIEAQPKSRGWRLRDRVGDRKRWYEEPEEV